MSTLIEAREKFAAKSAELADIFKQAGPDYDFAKVSTLEGDTRAKLDEVKRRNAELTDLKASLDSLEEVARMAGEAKSANAWANQPAPNGMVFPGGQAKAGPLAVAEPKSLYERISDSPGRQAFIAGAKSAHLFSLSPAEFKTLLTLGDMNNVATRLPGIREYAQEERTVADLMLGGQTDNNTLTYMEETTFTNAAAEVAEGGTKPESALDFTERTENVRKIATWIPATRELLQDVRGFQSYIEGRLRFMVRRREETQLLVGDGTAPNISGILDRSGIQTQAKGADPVYDAIYKAMTKVRNTGWAEPTAIVMHPNDWEAFVLTRTADGLYIMGNPGDPEADNRVWGLQVRVTTAITENTALVGAFRPHAQIFRREDIVVTVSTEHSTYFVENKVAILAEERLALAVYRPTAFCSVTGL